MAVRGHVDTMEGSYIVGWAVAEPDTGNCAITITNPAGEVIAKGRASRHRQDLASLGLGRTTLAFRIAVTLPTEPVLLRIQANGEELPGSPLQLGPNQFDGHCYLEGTAITGWITERRAKFLPPHVTIIDQDGTEVGRGDTSFQTKTIDPLFTSARFSIELDNHCFGAGERQLSVLANGVPFGQLSCDLKLRGNLETVTVRNCSGWLLSPASPDRVFEIEVFRDGVLAGTASCEQSREDVRGIIPDCGTPGFSIELDAIRHSEVEATTLSLRLAGSQRELFDGPYIIASRPASVAWQRWTCPASALRNARCCNKPSARSWPRQGWNTVSPRKNKRAFRRPRL
jgi:hypothetical protein